MAIRQLSMVSVPVRDQEAARRFYTEALGFTVKFDYVMDAPTAGGAGAGARWLMLTPPGGGADIALVTWFSDTTPPGSAKLSLTCDDPDETHADLLARGFRPNNEVTDAPWGRWFGIDDPDGNNWLITAPAAVR